MMALAVASAFMPLSLAAMEKRDSRSVMTSTGRAPHKTDFHSSLELALLAAPEARQV